MQLRRDINVLVVDKRRMYKKNSRFEICVNLANRSHFDNWINFVVLIVMMNVV